MSDKIENNNKSYNDFDDSWSKEEFLASNSRLSLKKKISYYRKFTKFSYYLSIVSSVLFFITIATFFYKQSFKETSLINKDGVVKKIDASLENAVNLIIKENGK